MNLSVIIPGVNVSKIAKDFLLSIDESHIHVARNHVDFLYRLTEDYVLVVSIFNEFDDNKEHTRKEYLDMLFEEMNEIEIGLIDRAQLIIYRKRDYPIDVLGLPSKRFLSSKDNGPFSTLFFTIESIDDVLEYLCILYSYDKTVYPISGLGEEGLKYLRSKDTSPFNEYVFTLDSIDDVIDYLCCLYRYDKSLLEIQDFRFGVGQQ